MTQSEFIKKYCEASKITEGELNKLGNFSVPCYCGDETCKGWAMTCIENLKQHIELYVNNDFTHGVI